MWQGIWEPSTRLWILPPSPKTPPDNIPVHTSTSGTQYSGNAYHITSKGDLIQYLHPCLLCPPKRTIIKAIKNNQLATWPGLTATAVGIYLPDSSPAPYKDHMKRQRKGLRTTEDKLKEKLEVIEMERDIYPPLKRENMNHIFTSIATVDKKDRTINVKNIEDSPIRSI